LRRFFEASLSKLKEKLIGAMTRQQEMSFENPHSQHELEFLAKWTF
jgi:hypothetical protein